MMRRRNGWLITLLAAIAVAPASAQELRTTPQADTESYRAGWRGGPGLETDLRLEASRDAAETVLAPLPPTALPARQAGIAAPLQVGIHRELPTPRAGLLEGASLPWEPIADGGLVAALRFTSPGATALRLGLRITSARRGTELRFFGTRFRRVWGPYDRAMLQDNGAAPAARRRGDPDALFWSPVIEGDTIGVEIYVPDEDAADRLDLAVTRISHLFATPLSGGLKSLSHVGNSGDCQIDMACEPGHQSTGNAVAKIIFSTGGGSFLCSGQMVNDTDGTTFLEYFTTAGHCVGDSGSAASINFYWLFQRDSCAGPDPTSIEQTGGGAWLLNTDSLDTSTDVSFLLIKSPTPSGTSLVGFDSAQASGGIVSIHHPAGDVKRISQGTITGTEGWWSGSDGDTHYRVSWNSGTTEGGSSGSGLFSSGRLIGVLTGGGSSCTNPAWPDFYGRLDLSYPNIQKWLDPGVVPSISGSVNGVMSGPWTLYKTSGNGGTLNVTLTNTTGNPDLYVKSYLAPTFELFDCRSSNGSGDESCVVPNSGSTTYFIGVTGSGSFTVNVDGSADGGDDDGGDDDGGDDTGTGTLPGEPETVSPIGEIDDGMPSYVWKPVSGATEYQVRLVKDDGLLHDDRHDASGLCPEDETTCSIATAPMPELEEGEHIWTVRAWNPTGAGGWGSPLRFTVPDPLVPPVQATTGAPRGVIDHVDPDWDWPVVDTATRYTLRVNYPVGATQEVTLDADDVCDEATCGVRTIPGPVLRKGVHRWRVQAANDAGAGPWSTPTKVKVKIDARRPTPLVPRGAISDARPDFIWTDVEDAVSFEFDLQGRSGSTRLRLLRADATCAEGLCTLSTSAADALSEGKYSWTVQPNLANGRTGPRSVKKTFQVREP